MPPGLIYNLRQMFGVKQPGEYDISQDRAAIMGIVRNLKNRESYTLHLSRIPTEGDMTRLEMCVTQAGGKSKITFPNRKDSSEVRVTKISTLEED